MALAAPRIRRIYVSTIDAGSAGAMITWVTGATIDGYELVGQAPVELTGWGDRMVAGTPL
jgi:hypothetical protein